MLVDVGFRVCARVCVLGGSGGEGRGDGGCTGEKEKILCLCAASLLHPSRRSRISPVIGVRKRAVV